ncbi:hypothetical protein H9Q74_009696 [Fusarium xylarioides]|nr:hypothetical protein H9Q71_010195 [Fusarium xylarioides]KAG5819035.1 hypothetical protein H9Q74_009696 [Fusarium xylarioides]
MLTHSQGRHQCHICTRCFSRNFDIVRGNPKLPSKDPAKSTADQRNTDADEPTSASAPACGSETSLIVDHAAAGPDIAKSALHLLFEVVNSSSSDLQKTLQDFEVSVEVMTWFEAQCQAHSEHLHHRWPVIHYTSFEIMSDPIVLVAIVILLGCQIRKESCPGVLEVHSALTMSLCHHLLSTKFVSDEAWDFGLFQAMHLTTLFAFLSKKTT